MQRRAWGRACLPWATDAASQCVAQPRMHQVSVQGSAPRMLTSHRPPNHARHRLLSLLCSICPDRSRRLQLLHGSHVLPWKALHAGQDIMTNHSCSCCRGEPQICPSDVSMT